ncbi:hypothetical protein TRICI_005961 [Trichomonascus ciferrii]|uniref:Uncharacterized protein n=1 Tax=Trichomonascus ciferrii TaxID=44093 RepID=A0A642UN13_9ASCO|nr:hypothetical protein TRICI_005961 [Trichomonascus ciferrii]
MFPGGTPPDPQGSLRSRLWDLFDEASQSHGGAGGRPLQMIPINGLIREIRYDCTRRLFDLVADVAFREHDGGAVELDGVDDLLAEPDGEGDEGDDGPVGERVPVEVAEVRGRAEGEGAEVEADEEELVEGAEDEERGGARVVEVEDLAALADLLVGGRARGQHGVHVHVVRGQIQTHQQLEQHRPPRIRHAQVADERRRRAPVRDHVQHRAEAGRLAKAPRRRPVQSVQNARQPVQNRAVLRVPPHVVEGRQRKHDPHVSNQVRDVQKHPRRGQC